MINIIKVVFFDLFFTLIRPDYNKNENEYNILNITKDEWEQYAENDIVYIERALGKIKEEDEIIDKITSIMPFHVNDNQKIDLLHLRQNRMKNALTTINKRILNTLASLKSADIIICLISNADTIDCKYWRGSPLSQLFDDTVFSCNVGMMKPNIKIYEYAMCRQNAAANECLFVGDGGSNELVGARQAGMHTVFSEFLDKKDEIKRIKLINDSDYHIKDFEELINIIHGISHTDGSPVNTRRAVL